jgi:16S rRNA processing protein RimM
VPLPETGWLAVGRIRRPHGIHGEILVEQVTDFPERMVAGLEVALGETAPDRRVKVLQVRSHKGSWLLAVEGVTSRDQVEEWRGQWVFLPPQERGQLPPTYFYEHELQAACVAGRTGACSVRLSRSRPVPAAGC